VGTKTGISWTDATWNPIRGCSRVSPGCKNCYASKIARRFSGPGGPYEGLVRINAAGQRTDEWNGEIKFVADHLFDPLKWKEPRKIFVNSMSDLLHDNITDSVLDRIANVMVLAYWHTFQILTKRPQNFHRLEAAIKKAIVANMELQEFGGMATRLEFRAVDMRRRDRVGWSFPLNNMHLGVSVEDQKTADARIPLLLQTPAAVRFISAEPLLGPVDLVELASFYEGSNRPLLRLNAFTGEHECGRQAFGPQWGSLDWVIVGGESGAGARPMHPDWARSLRDQCNAAKVPFFFKQWGEFTSEQCPGVDVVLSELKPGQCVTSGVRGHHTLYTRVGTKAAGCKLDGVEHHEFPAVVS
jgi:protein gp37